MIVKTRNSTYEIKDGKIRLVSTKKPGRYNLVTDEWKKYGALMGPNVGSVLRILWEDEETMTTTSTVVDIEDDELTGWAV